MTEPTPIRKAIREGAIAELYATAAAAHRRGDPTTHPDRITQILRSDPTTITFTGEYCWRHHHSYGRGRQPAPEPVVHPYDECAGCLDERADTNTWREDDDRPIQPPHVQAIYQPRLGDQ
jgi:hypothetical protein